MREMDVDVKYQRIVAILDLFLSEVTRQLPQAEGSQHRAEGTDKTDDD